MSTGSPSDPLPSWADDALSRGLAALASVGESQSLEFKAAFPPQATDLAKEIAAFATSNAGTILLGVADDGTICGLGDCATRDARAALVRRIEGLCAQCIRPLVTPAVRFAHGDGRTIAAIDVPKGSAPIYYARSIPYLRQLTASRAMTPDEVIEHVLAWDRARGGAQEPTPEARFLEQLATLVVEVGVFANELEQREVDPWLEETRSMLSILADQARHVAAHAPSSHVQCADELIDLGDQLDGAAHEELTLGGGWDEMLAWAKAAHDQARAIATKWLKPEMFNARSIDDLFGQLRGAARQVDQLAGRAAALIEQGRMDELRRNASAQGLLARRAAAFLSLTGKPERADALDQIGQALRELETRELYMDGGRSQRAIAEDLAAANQRLLAWVNAL